MKCTSVIHSTGVNTSTEVSGSKPRSNTKKNRILSAKSKNKKKVEDHPRTNKSVWTKVNRVDSSISSKRVVINLNSESMCKTCNKCLNSASHEMCVVNILNSVNDTPTVKIILNKEKQIWKLKGKLSDNSLNKTKQIWKPKGKLSDYSLNKTKQVWKATGKLFANVGYQWRSTGKKVAFGKLNCGYQWRPTGKKFALGELCPLTKLSVQCCSKHMTGNRSKLKNFVEKFIGSVRFGNDHLGAIMGYGDYVIGDSVISRVYYVEGLGHNLFSVGQFCDSDLEVAFRKHTCFVRDINGTDILKGSRSTNLYTISIDEMMKSSPICLLSKASKSKSWLWHRRLNHLNFGTINDLARKDLVRGLPRLKFEKDHLCSACQLGKSKKFSHRPKSENTNMEVLHTLHMDLCGPMRVQSIKGKKYILVIVDDYSRFTWVKFLRSKDETPEFVINFLKQIQLGLNKTVRFIRTDNGTEFVNQVMSEYYEGVGIFHQKSVPRTPQQNGVVERRNRTLVEAARTMMIFSNKHCGAATVCCYSQKHRFGLNYRRYLAIDSKLNILFAQLITCMLGEPSLGSFNMGIVMFSTKRAKPKSYYKQTQGDLLQKMDHNDHPPDKSLAILLVCIYQEITVSIRGCFVVCFQITGNCPQIRTQEPSKWRERQMTGFKHAKMKFTNLIRLEDNAMYNLQLMQKRRINAEDVGYAIEEATTNQIFKNRGGGYIAHVWNACAQSLDVFSVKTQAFCSIGFFSVL
ncbi:retrovirus-related pol polyprotein from transposon TNT 1-94 [Tanacetum coccineum]